MISNTALKEIIQENRDYILKAEEMLVPRRGLVFAEKLKKVVILHGVRRSGKTFVLYDIFLKNRDRSLYIDFEDERLTNFETKDFDRLKGCFFELYPHLLNEEPVFLLDEVQRVENWEKFCRRITERENIKVFASGSSSEILPSKTHTSLRGRAWNIELFPFSFAEVIMVPGINGKEKNKIYGKDRILVKNQSRDFIKWGGFPEIVLSSSEMEKKKILKEYIGAMYFRDIVERYKITNIPLLDAMMDALLSSSSTRFSLNSFYKHNKERISFSKDFLYEYYKYFLESTIIFEARTFSQSSYKRLRNPPKVYLVDTGLSKGVRTTDIGRLLENSVFIELKRRGYEIYYHDGKGECDFVVKGDKGEIECLQVSFEINENNKRREIDGLVEACKENGLKIGKIITFDDESEIESNGISIKMIPFWKWALE
ncbi:MAG: ATP-binding protein [Pseudomonadota bacterium]